MKLKEAQDRSFELLCLIDDICGREGVPYFLTGGSEIGAVREKDIIPWDDDIDINVRFSDYPAFREAMRRCLPNHIRLVEPVDFAPRFYDFVVRVVDTTAPRRRDTEENRFYGQLQNNLCIDVFLVFHVPENRLLRGLARLRLTGLYGLGMGHRHHVDYSQFSPAQKLAVGCLRTVGRMIPARTVCRRYFKAVERLDRHRDSPWGMINWFTGYTWERMAWFDSAAEGELRGRRFPIAAGYDGELTMFYGDYMHPPKDRNAFVQHLDEEDRWET